LTDSTKNMQLFRSFRDKKKSKKYFSIGKFKKWTFILIALLALILC